MSTSNGYTLTDALRDLDLAANDTSATGYAATLRYGLWRDACVAAGTCPLDGKPLAECERHRPLFGTVTTP